MTQPPADEFRVWDARSPAFAYFVLCVACTGIVAVSVMEGGQSKSTLVGVLLLLVGLMGLLIQLSVAPLLFVVCIVLSLMLSQSNWYIHLFQIDPSATPPFRLRDLILAMGVLGYVVVHYRLQGLSRHLFPPDQRFAIVERLKQAPQDFRRAIAPRKRADQQVKSDELLGLIVSLPLWALTAHVVWWVVAHIESTFGWEAWFARLAVLLTVLVVGIMTVSALLGYVHRRCMEADEATVLLQDVLWNGLRGEMRWHARWLAWFWLHNRQDRG